LGMIWREGVYLSHGAGTARSYELGQQEGVVASLVMMLSGVTMVLIAPLVAWVMF
ncbi:LrgB family protein, partial [Enterobacter hormaechei]